MRSINTGNVKRGAKVQEIHEGQPNPASSVLAFFGDELRRRRLAQGWSQGELARRVFGTGAMISYLETTKRVPTADQARAFDETFDCDIFLRLHPLIIKHAYPSWFLPFINLERDAASMSVFESQIIPGLLQTENYARAMLSAVRPDNLDDLVAARMARQDVFDREKPLRAWFVLDENVLLRPIGGSGVFQEQLERLLICGREPRTVIQVIPRTVVAHAGLAGPFTVLGFDEGADVLYVDSFSQGRIALDANEVAAATHAYDLLRAVALSPEASADMIGTHMKELGR